MSAERWNSKGEEVALPVHPSTVTLISLLSWHSRTTSSRSSCKDTSHTTRVLPPNNNIKSANVQQMQRHAYLLPIIFTSKSSSCCVPKRHRSENAPTRAYRKQDRLASIFRPCVRRRRVPGRSMKLLGLRIG